jgi:hypothetical protein
LEIVGIEGDTPVGEIFATSELQELVISVKVQFSLEAKALSFPPGEYEGNF